MAKFAKWMFVIILFCSLFFNSPNTLAEGDVAIVKTPTLNIRSGPGLSYDVIGLLKQDDRVHIMNRSGDWLQVKNGNKSGWIASWLTTSTLDKIHKPVTIVSRVDGLNVRSEPTISSAVIGRMVAGENAVMNDRKDEWAYVNIGGTNGWVHLDFITEVNNPTTTVSTEETSSLQSFIVSVDTLNVRNKPDLTSKVVGQIHKGNTFAVKAIEGNWVQLAINNEQEGWVFSFHGTLSTKGARSTTTSASETVTVLTNGTNVRTSPTTSSPVAARADAGEKLEVLRQEGDWYEIILPTGNTAFIATWVVSSEAEKIHSSLHKKTEHVRGTLNGYTIVIDPGHGGNDRGTTGARGTDEKEITLLTAELLATKLRSAGATVVLTRESDTFVTLRKRVAISHQHNADAFISLHYDSNPDSSINGFTTYYTHPTQKKLATAVNDGLGSTISLRNRDTQRGDFLVLRENRQNSILIELGFLSNASEERTITTERFREQATHGIYQGLLAYFDEIHE